MRNRACACLAVTAVLLSACGGSSPVTQDGTYQLRAFQSLYLAFRYPAPWKAHRYRNQSEFSTAIVYLSNELLHPPCSHPRPRLLHCGAPLDRLGPGGVLVEWSANGFPGWSFKKARGQRMWVDGLPAKLAADRRDGCQGVGGDLGLVLTVKRPGAPHNWYELRACFAQPNAAEAEREVRTLIGSTTFTQR